MRGRIVALLLPVLLLAGLAVVPAQPASAAATGVTCVEYLVGSGSVRPRPPLPDLPLHYTRLDATAQATDPRQLRLPRRHGPRHHDLRGPARRHRHAPPHPHGRRRRQVSHAPLYVGVAAGDIVEWRVADDCWVRYEVTSLLPDPPATAPRKHLAVEWVLRVDRLHRGIDERTLAAMLRIRRP